MANIRDIMNAIDEGNTELVQDLAQQLDEEGIDLTQAYNRADMKNRVKKTRGYWQDIVDILHSYVYDD